MIQGNRAILFLTSWYPVQSNPSHGIFVKHHAIALSQFQKVSVAYAYASDEGPHYKVETIVINENLTEYIVKYPRSSGLLKSFGSFSNNRKAHHIILEHLLQQKVWVKAIQVNVIFPATVALDLYKNVFKVKHTIVEHWSGYLPEDNSYNGFALEYYTKKCIKGAAKIWHVSQPQKAAMERHGLTGNYELLYNAVNTTEFVINKEQTKKMQLLHVSSLVEKEKNISGTLNVLKKLQEENPDVNIVIAGGHGAELTNAKTLARQLNLNNITFTGAVPSNKISELMQNSTALILFSNYEGMPVVVLEAMSCGLPVFASKVGQLPYIIKDEYGVLVDRGNETQMINAFRKFFAGQYKFDSVAMRQFVEINASYEAVGKQMNAFYKTLD